MLSLNDFSPITLENKDIIEKFFRRYPQVHSDNTIITMLTWNHYAHYHYAILNNSLIIMTIVDGERTFRPPIGEEDDALLSDLLCLAFEEGGSTPFQMLDEAGRNWFLRLHPDIPLYEEPEFADYVYLSTDLAGLPGKKYLTIRGHLNKFNKTTDFTVEAIRSESIAEIYEFLEKWCEWKQCDEYPFLAYEKDAVLYAVRHYDELNCQGILIRTEQGIGAIAIWGHQNDDTIVVHYEKALPGYEGIYKAINMQTAKAVQSRYRFINRESDMGEPGLREAKRRYHPHHMAPVWSVRRANMNARRERFCR